MAIVTIWGEERVQTGKTLGAIALGSLMAMHHNIKILIISTSYNDQTMRESFGENRSKRKNLFADQKMPHIEQNGAEGLSRLIISNKLTPDIVPDYAKAVLNGRLEVLYGLNGLKESYINMQPHYKQIIEAANKHYNMVIVDLDKEINPVHKRKILEISDVVLCFASQRPKSIQYIADKIKKKDVLKPNRSVIVLGRYDEELKYNAKNISRTMLKQKEIVNTIPYNKLYYQAAQEGTVIDLFLRLLKVSERDPNYMFATELDKLIEKIFSILKKNKGA